MTKEDYIKTRDRLFEKAVDVSTSKAKDYTVGSEDVLANFKTVARRTGMSPLQVLGIYMMKHQDAISNYIRTGGQSESEPIEMRIIDNINYLFLLSALINDICINEGKGKKTPTVCSKGNIDCLPTTRPGMGKIDTDGPQGSGRDTFTRSEGDIPILDRMQERGERQHIQGLGTSGAQLLQEHFAPRSFQEKLLEDLRRAGFQGIS
jgi:hypothetical protein